MATVLRVSMDLGIDRTFWYIVIQNVHDSSVFTVVYQLLV
jgi:hypothetical protein